MQNDPEILRSFAVEREEDLILVTFTLRIVDTDENVRRAYLAVQQVYTILVQDTDRTFKILIDMSQMGASRIPTRANKIYLEALKKEQIQHVAIVGDFKLQLKVLSFITPFIVGEGKKVVWFPNRAEALLWLEKV